MQMTKSMNLAKKQTSSYTIRGGVPPTTPAEDAPIPRKKRNSTTSNTNLSKKDADLLESSNDQQDGKPPLAAAILNNSNSNDVSNGDNNRNTNTINYNDDNIDNSKTSEDTGIPTPNPTQDCTDTPSEVVSKASAKRKKKKKSKTKNVSSDASSMRESHWLVDTRNNAVRNTGDEFWSSTNNSEERQKIREFWLQLGEEERRSLVKVEKEAVLRKMKEQQKHSCNCSVCGKKRTAIEDELEVLYDAYYEELEQYANHQQQTRFYNGVDRLTAPTYDVDSYENGYVDPNVLDEEEDDEDEEDEEDDYEGTYEDEDEEDVGSQSDQSDALSDGEGSSYDDDIPYSSSQLAHASNDHFHFGNSLTVKGGILTVADDLLKNDGKKFLDMMERLAERRIQKEEEVLEQADEYYDEGDEEDDEAYDDDDDEDTRTEEQRMEEGRRMFQIFAARMFEQRVLAAYREKVARERQQRLIQELEEEERLERERELKKQKEKEKKRDKKRQMKKQKEEERLAKEAKRKADEEAARLEREKKLEAERQKREQERQKREEERRLREEERIRKEEEKKRREEERKRKQQEEAAEKERQRKEKEEKARLEREASERKQREQREREEKDRVAKRKAEEATRLAREKAEKKMQQEAAAKSAKPVPSSSSASSSSAAAPALTAPTATATATAAPISPGSSIKQKAPARAHLADPIPVPGPFSPAEDMARQKSLMDALIGSSATSSSSSQGAPSLLNAEARASPLDLHQPPHPLLPLNRDFLKASRFGGEPSLTSPTRAGHPVPPIPMDRAGMLPIGFGRMATSFDAASSSSSSSSSVPGLHTSKPISRPSVAPIGPPSGARRTSAVAGSVGSPVGRTNRLMSADDGSSHFHQLRPLATAGEHDAGHSFFSNFLFGERGRDIPALPSEHEVRMDKPERRFSLESGAAGGMGWTNGWTASTALSDNVHGKLFGDVLGDRTSSILERARNAYYKLDEITQSKFFRNPSQFHTLVQLHRMMCDMYYDAQVDIRELYEVISSPMSGFQCLNHAQHGCVVWFDGTGGLVSPTTAMRTRMSPPSISLSSGAPAVAGFPGIPHSTELPSSSLPLNPLSHPAPPPPPSQQQQPHQQQQPQHPPPGQQPPHPSQQLNKGNAHLFGSMS